jgi:YaiO family outer membrane protein
MRFALRLMMCIVLIFSYGRSEGQWLKMIESSDNLYKEAKREIDLKRYQRAINLCRKGIDISPKNLDLHVLLGRAYSLAGKVDSARLELNHVIEKNPKYRDAYIYLVNMEAAVCNYQQALEYADMGLKYFSNDRDLLLKKLDIYNKMGEWTESNKLAEYLFDRFSTDPYIRSVYLEYKLTIARTYSHRGYIEIAKRAYEAVLEQDPLNKEAMQAIYSLDVRSGNYESSLAFVNRALQATPNSYEFLIKKISILEAMSRYVDAVAVAEKLRKLYPGNPEVQRLNTYVRMEAGRYYMKTDPYVQFGSVLERDPGNREALDNIINIAFSRGLLMEALSWINTGLKRYPNDNELLKKKMSVLDDLKRYGAAADIAERFYKQNRTAYNKENYLELRTLSAKQYLNDMEFDSAIASLRSVLFYDPGNITAINYLVSAYSQQNRYDEAIHALDEALAIYPNDEQLLFKKAGTLEASQHFAEAAAITRELLKKHPENRRYLIALVEQSMAASRQSMQYDDYYSTIDILKEVLDKQPDNVDALNYLINIEMALKHHTTALYYVDIALHHYPDSKDFLFKKSIVYADAKMYRAAYTVSGELFANNPYNTRYKNAYIEQLLSSGREYLSYDEKDSALMEFEKALRVSPNDTLPLYYNINTLFELKRYDSALMLVNRGRLLYPNNPYFLMKRAAILESMLMWEAAWRSADTLTKMVPNEPKYQDYAQFLYSHFLKNEMGFFYLQAKLIDSSLISKINSIATVHYTRYIRRGQVTFRVNYAGRLIGSGFQFEGETYYNHRKDWTSYAVLAYSPTELIFPKFRAGYSLSHAFQKGYTGELGGRYLINENGNVISPMAAISKEIKDFYLTLRSYYIFLTHNEIGANYFSAVFTSRYYLTDNHTQFFTALAGYGTAPDDISRNWDISRLSAYNTVSVGFGYQRTFQYRTVLGINGSWYNSQISANNFRNQWDIYLTLRRKF